MLLRRIERHLRALRRRRARQYRPRLRDRIDATLLGFRRAERRSIVVERSAIPVAIPSCVVQRITQPVAILAVARHARLVRPRFSYRDEVAEYGEEKTPEPHALAAAAAARA